MRNLFLAFFVIAQSFNVQAADIDPSGYSLYTGGKFYVLTDGVFSSEEIIKVRFEAAGNTSLQQYGGVDVRLYRVPKPIEFLKKQKNLHRPDLKGKYEGEGLSNVLSYIWDSWYKKTRLAWQRVFSTTARQSAVKAVPQLKQTPAHSYQTTFSNESQFKHLPGLELVDSFRYPVWDAKPNQPPKETTMQGSSSNFIQTSAGNVMLPMGKRKPGLYLVEALLGSYRATTLVFVSDSMAVSKVSSNQAFIWTVNRLTGVSHAKSKIVLTDGVGVLDQGTSNADGIFISKREIPEKTFVLTEDESGGVSISENFFYNSEAYVPKLYVFTDRPLYQPGDTVSVRAFGGNIKREGSKDRWSAISGSSGTLSIIDAAGIPLLTKKMIWSGAEGGEVQFKLPNSAESGGYTLKLQLGGEDYGAAFRVARFTKPHFDAQILFSKPSYKVGEAVKGRVLLSYPSGQPVVGAEIDLQLRSEQMTVYEGSYGYNGSASVELTQKTYQSNDRGEIEFSFPAAAKPSRYIASARAFDQSAYRVSTKKEVLIEGYLETYILKSDFSATDPGTAVKFRFDRQGSEAADTTQKLKSWQIIRLEDREVKSGTVPSVDRGDFTVTFARPGHYVVRVVDAGGVTRGVRSHIVLGPGLKSTNGQVEILADREDYAIGDTANIILTFPTAVDDALLTLERNDVSAYGRLGKGADWFKAKKISEAQWKVEVPIKDLFAPNIILSVAYAKGGIFSFQNKGLVVKKPMIDIVLKPSKTIYSPREKVVIELETKFAGKPVAAMVALSVVDEMIYVLQPEIAPTLGEFFHHIRRNQVRTSSSLSFYSYNPAISEAAPGDSTRARRDLKLLQERARRDANDTAYWNGKIKTDANGKARIEFVMPDALTRWRMTARAVATSASLSAEGVVGDSKSYITSNQDYYMKWTGPTLFRDGDKAMPAIVAFNSTQNSVDAEVAMKAPNYSFSQKIKMRPGANTVTLSAIPTSSLDLESRLMVDSRSVDLLATKLTYIPRPWSQTQSTIVRLDKGAKANLPPSAQQVRMKVVSDSSYHFLRIAEDLVAYPWGCVEQTSSRMIPLVMAAKALEAGSSNEPVLRGLVDQISGERRRLVSMAGPDAAFTWWGDETAKNLFMTAHAYHADFRASKFLGIDIPKKDWEYLLGLYAKADAPSVMQRAYALWVLSYIGQPVSEQLSALIKEAALISTPLNTKAASYTESFVVDSAYDSELGLIIMGIVAAKSNVQIPPQVKTKIEQLARSNWSSPVMMAASLNYLVRTKAAIDSNKIAETVLESIRFESPTADRAMALAFIEDALPSMSSHKKNVIAVQLGADWKQESPGSLSYRWKGKGLPNLLPQASGASAEIIFESPEATSQTLAAEVSRKFFKVLLNDSNNSSDGEGSQLEVVEVSPGESFDTRSLYIDEVTITPKATDSKFLLVEAPLPPGADVDSKTWGLEFGSFTTNFIEPRPASMGLGYSIPVEALGSSTKFHQLVRFSSRGQFQVPPIKVFKMYKTSERTYETGIKSRGFVVK